MICMAKLKVYLDICCFNRPFDDQIPMRIRLETEAKLYIQRAIYEKKLALAWSYMLEYENSNSPYEERANAILLWKDLAEMQCPSADDVLAHGKELMKLGIKPCDALHIACALKCGCDYFITTDKLLLNKKVANIKIANPIDFVTETEVDV